MVEKIAEVLYWAYQDLPVECGQDSWFTDTVNQFADMLEASGENFDREKFIVDCGVDR